MTDVISLDSRRPKPPENMASMCEITIYDNGDVAVWLSDQISDVDQFNWLFAKLAGATGSLFQEKRARTEHE